MPPIRESRTERETREQTQAANRYSIERRLQATGLLLLALAVLLATVLRAGIHNVFLPRWWHPW